MSMGERPQLAIHHPAASARMAIGEALTNLAGTRVRKLSHVKLSANWMAAAGTPGQDAALRAAVEAASDISRSLRSEEHTSELQSRGHLVCRLLREKK